MHSHFADCIVFPPDPAPWSLIFIILFFFNLSKFESFIENTLNSKSNSLPQTKTSVHEIKAQRPNWYCKSSPRIQIAKGSVVANLDLIRPRVRRMLTARLWGEGCLGQSMHFLSVCQSIPCLALQTPSHFAYSPLAFFFVVDFFSFWPILVPFMPFFPRVWDNQPFPSWVLEGVKDLFFLQMHLSN